MPFISASAISPYNSIRGGAAAGEGPSILDFAPYNVWDSDSLSIVSTLTTAIDYNEVGAAYDLANPSPDNQPTFNSSDTGANGYPSLSFDGTTDYLINPVSNWRTSDSSGLIVFVAKYISGRYYALTTTDNASTNYYLQQRVLANKFEFLIKGSGINDIYGSTDVNDGNYHVIAYASTGSEYKMFVDGALETINIQSGSNNGKWLSALIGTDSVAIGALYTPGITYSEIDWVFSGYFPYVDDATCIAISDILKTKYNI
jgi:hypothetical protein